jgi:glycosyltransferase involved in cell wall biosynthesis
MKNLFIITSVINTPNKPLSYISTRSVYSREERFNQTQITIISIRKYIPDCFIFLVECTDFTNDEYDGIENEPYRRVWTKPVSSYASNYNLFDISLAPLVENTFNKVKSQLKVIESGFHKKALIAQDFGPYQIDLINAKLKVNSKDGNGQSFNENGNAYLVNNNPKEWYQFIKKLVNNPDQIEILANNLYDTVKDTYSIEAVSEKRKELYLSLVNGNRNSSIQSVLESDSIRI